MGDIVNLHDHTKLCCGPFCAECETAMVKQDEEVADLRAQLAAAEKVVEAARKFRNRCPKHPFEEGEVPCTCGRQELDAALAAYPPKPASERTT